MLNNKLAYGLAVVLLAISFYGSYSFFLTSKSKEPMSPLTKQPTTAEIDVNEPKTEECPMNGQLFSKSQKKIWEKRRPLGIMIENSTDARPQSGLSSADIIYEIVAEGGITRFLTIFYCQDAKFVGPVRSARIYFLTLLQEYGQHPLYAHVGGANTDGPADALGQIEALGWAGFNDLNQFSVPFPNFWRDYDRLPNRATEHTVYTATSKLWSYAKSKRDLTEVDSKNKPWDALFKKWQFKDDAKLGNRGEDGGKVSFGFWTAFANDYAVTWTYNRTNNTYTRENGGVLHLDKNTGKALESKNVIVIFSEESPANDGYPGGHLLYELTGKGDAIVFKNGVATKVTWNKKNEKSRMIFTDLSGDPVSFVRGQIFVEVLPTENKVTY